MKLTKIQKDKIYQILFDSYSCGPFDGGCLIFAEALQMKYGGEIYVLYSKKFAEHAVLFLNGKLIDFDGPLEPKKFIRRLEKNENIKIDGYRKFENSDLSDLSPDKEISKLILEIL